CAGSPDRSPAEPSSSATASARHARTPTTRSDPTPARSPPDPPSPSSTTCPRRSRATEPPPPPAGPRTSQARSPHDGTRPGTSLDDPHGPPSSRVSPRIRCPPKRGNSIPPLEQDWQLPPASRVLSLEESVAQAPDIYDWTLRFAYGIE